MRPTIVLEATAATADYVSFPSSADRKGTGTQPHHRDEGILRADAW